MELAAVTACKQFMRDHATKIGRELTAEERDIAIQVGHRMAEWAREQQRRRTDNALTLEEIEELRQLKWKA